MRVPYKKDHLHSSIDYVKLIQNQAKENESRVIQDYSQSKVSSGKVLKKSADFKANYRGGKR